MSNPQNLTIAGVKRQARAFYKAGKLTAQHPDQNKRTCTYRRRGGYRCAIGASLDDNSFRRIAKCGTYSMSTEQLISDGVITMPAAQREEIRLLQWFHDQWCLSSRACGADDPETATKKQVFLKVIAA